MNHPAVHAIAISSGNGSESSEELSNGALFCHASDGNFAQKTIMPAQRTVKTANFFLLRLSIQTCALIFAERYR
jgi:hypothetical protein